MVIARSLPAAGPRAKGGRATREGVGLRRQWGWTSRGTRLHKIQFGGTAMTEQRPIKLIRAGELEVAYEESGPSDGTPIVLLHGFPYDPRAYDEVVPILTAAGCRAI